MFKLVHVPWLHHPFCTGRSVLQKARNADVAAAALLIRSRKEGNFSVLLQPTVHTQPLTTLLARVILRSCNGLMHSRC